MTIATDSPDRARYRPGLAKPALRGSGDALRPVSGGVHWFRSPAIVMRGWRPRQIAPAKPAWPWLRLSAIVAGVFGRLREWQEREHAREFLLRLDDRSLRDIGLTRLDASREVNKPFWRK